MKSIKQILFILLLSSISITVSYAQENTSYFLHTVEKGQNLYSISSMYNIASTEIIRLNPGSDEKIYAGQTLKIPQAVSVSTEQNSVFHTIEAGETLYKLSGKYNVSVKEICDENPGLSAENFKSGQVIRIPTATSTTEQPVVSGEIPQIQPEVKPRCRDMHKVKRKETIFSVSREYNISEKELMEANPELRNGMKKGQLLCIPYPKAVEVEPSTKKTEYIIPPTNRELFRDNREEIQSIRNIRAALILPFLVEDRRTDAVRMIEYYEGFLMAVDSLKRKGTSIDLYVYNSGDENTSIAPILAKDELKSMDVIFGPLYKQHIQPLGAFADEHNIRLVVPILKDDEVYQNSNIYQVNTPQSYLYSEVYEHFTRQFPNGNVIILDMHTEDKDKGEFIQGLKVELERKRIPVQVVNGASLSQAALKNALRSGMDNIFIPTSGNAITLNKIMPQLKILVKDNATANISLFGYPEWQTYINDNLDSFFELDTYFYSSFYTSNLLPAAKQFNQAYRRWYSKEMLSSYPKYGMLGFDTALYFLTGLEKYGTGLEYNLSSIDLTPVQTGFKFERVNNWGGFVNKKVFFIHFTRDFELIKLDFE